MKYIITIESSNKLFYYEGDDFFYNKNKFMTKTLDKEKAKRYKSKSVAYQVIKRLQKQVVNYNDTINIESVIK